MEQNLSTIVQGNMLVEASYKLNIDEFRLLNLALSQIDSVEAQPDHPYEITPEAFSKAFNVSRRHVHNKLKEAASSLLRKPITTYLERDGKVYKNERPWFSMVEYCTQEDERAVKIEFSIP